MFQHTNGTKPFEMLERFASAQDGRVNVFLAKKPVQIYFAMTRAADLRAVIDTEPNGEAGNTQDE